jgi:hypothetical protein
MVAVDVRLDAILRTAGPGDGAVGQEQCVIGELDDPFELMRHTTTGMPPLTISFGRWRPGAGTRGRRRTGPRRSTGVRIQVRGNGEAEASAHAARKALG